MANTTWSTTDRVNTTLSGGNLKATQNATNSGVRSVSFKTSGKHYWEVTVTANQSETGFGISNAGPVKIGSCYVNFIGRIILQGVGTGDSIGSLSNGSVVCFALDMTNKLFWIRQGASGRWNGRVNADPATGVGGRDISSITSTGIFALFCNPATTLGELGTDDADTTAVGDTTATANFGDSGFVGVAPAGFTVGLTSVTTTLSTTLSASRPGVGSVVVTTTGVAITAPIVGVGTVAMPLLTTPVITTTWNPSDKSANITLSDGDLTAAPTTGTDGAVRSSTAKSPGSKTYFEISWAGGANTNTAAGIATASAALGSIGGFAVGGLLVAVTTGLIWYNGSSTGIALGVATGSVMCFAVDLVNSRLWARLGNGLWNNSGTANPTTNVGGINISALFSAANAYAATSFNTTLVQANVNFGVRPFLFAVPSGFDRWDTQTLFPPYVSWNPGDKSAGIALSSGNLIAKNINNAVCGARTVNGQFTGKFYWECTCDVLTYTSGTIGVTSSGAILNQGANNLGTGCGVITSGTIYLNGTSTGATLGAITAGNLICVAVDITNRLIWFRRGAAGNWNGVVGADPATGVGGISIIALAPNVMYPWIVLGNTNDQVTSNFGDTAFGGAVPSGFTSGFPTGTPPLAAAVTQLGVEEWGQLSFVPGIAQATQVALEQWATISFVPSRALITQLGLEEWVRLTALPPTGGFVGFAPQPKATGNAGANSIYLTTLVVPRNGAATAVLLEGGSSVGGYLRALIYDSSHSALLASGPTTTIRPGYNRLPLTSNLTLVAGTTYYVGYVCNASCEVGIQVTGGPISWWANGGQSLSSPANPLVAGASSTPSLMIALELDGTGLPAFGWGPDQAAGVTLSASNTLAAFPASANKGVRGIVTHTNGIPDKFYAEVDVGGTINNNIGIGLATVNCGVEQGPFLSTTNPGFPQFLAPNGFNSTGLVGFTYAPGDTIGIAYDCAASLLWWNKNNGSWWGVNTVGNPVTRVNGKAFYLGGWPIAIGAVTSTAAAATFRLRDTADQLRYAPPVGYSAWSSESVPIPPVVLQRQYAVSVIA